MGRVRERSEVFGEGFVGSVFHLQRFLGLCRGGVITVSRGILKGDLITS